MTMARQGIGRDVHSDDELVARQVITGIDSGEVLGVWSPAGVSDPGAEVVQFVEDGAGSPYLVPFAIGERAKDADPWRRLIAVKTLATLIRVVPGKGLSSTTWWVVRSRSERICR
jgi:hypothetical protein